MYAWRVVATLLLASQTLRSEGQRRLLQVKGTVFRYASDKCRAIQARRRCEFGLRKTQLYHKGVSPTVSAIKQLSHLTGRRIYIWRYLKAVVGQSSGGNVLKVTAPCQ